MIATLYDIHGNLPALEAVLADPRLATVDLIVVGDPARGGMLPPADADPRKNAADGRHRRRVDPDDLALAARGERPVVPEFLADLVDESGIDGEIRPSASALDCLDEVRSDQDNLAGFLTVR